MINHGSYHNNYATFPIAFTTTLYPIIAIAMQWGFAVAISERAVGGCSFSKWQTANGGGNTDWGLYMAIGY